MKCFFVYGLFKSNGSVYYFLKGIDCDCDGVVDGFIEIEYWGYLMLYWGNGVVLGEVYWVFEFCWFDLDDWEEVFEVY